MNFNDTREIRIESEVSDLDLIEAFTNTNFGPCDHRHLLEASVLKKLVGYHCGHTITEIMKNLGLIGIKGVPTKKGKRFVAHAFNHLMTKGG